MTDGAGWLFLLVEVFFVDLMLGGDNAVVIALACRRLPHEDMRRAVVVGAVGAIVLRLVMILFANALLGVPLVKLVAAWTLIVIALNVMAHGRDDEPLPLKGAASGSDFLSAAVVIMFADAAMSLDNVIALAAIAAGNFWLMAIGVLLSIPILVYGAVILTQIIDRAPAVLTIGAAFLGWIAGGMATSDPLVAGWIDSNAPAVAVFAPALGAVFVLVAGGSTKPRRSASLAPTKQAPPAKRETVPPAPSAPARIVSEPVLTIQSDSQDAPAFAAMDRAGSFRVGWTEERVVVVGFVLLAFLAGLIIAIASFFDSLT